EGQRFGNVYLQFDRMARPAFLQGKRSTLMRPIVLVLDLFACGKGQNPQPPADIQLHVQLQKAASCSALEENVQDTAVRQMRLQLDQEKSWNSGGVVLAAGGAPASRP